MFPERPHARTAIGSEWESLSSFQCLSRRSPLNPLVTGGGFFGMKAKGKRGKGKRGRGEKGKRVRG
jgi:hypothetical protein